MRQFAIRPTDARNWPCPWACYDRFRSGSDSMSSWPNSWPLEAARKWVDNENAKDHSRGMWAVFSVTPRGQKQTQIHPKG